MNMREVTVEQMREDREAVARLIAIGPVAVMHEGRAVAFLGVDSNPTVLVVEREEDSYTDNGAARGDAVKALAASVDTSYWSA